MTDIGIVCDNAPVHSNIEAVLQEDEFIGVLLLRLAPYSTPLNPIEECWSVFKCELQKLNMNGLQNLLNNPTPEGFPQTEYRLCYLERLIDESISKITHNLCMKTSNHVQKHSRDCLALKDLNMGAMMD
jgi:hypothetical protein